MNSFHSVCLVNTHNRNAVKPYVCLLNSNVNLSLNPTRLVWTYAMDVTVYAAFAKNVTVKGNYLVAE